MPLSFPSTKTVHPIQRRTTLRRRLLPSLDLMPSDIEHSLQKELDCHSDSFKEDLFFGLTSGFSAADDPIRPNDPSRLALLHSFGSFSTHTTSP